MSDPPVREIHLSRKQLAFGVISAVGVSVVVFLLGVSVGRGVIATSAGSAAVLDRGATADAGAAVTPPSSLDAADRTSGSAGSAGLGANSIPMKIAEPPAPPPEMPPAKSDVPEAPVTKTPAPKAAPAAAPQHAAAKPDAQKPAPATAASHSDWVVQVDSFKSKENADRLVTKLKAAGYAAFELSPQSGGSPYYRAQIGPFADRPEADKVASRLTKEGYKPSVTR